MRRLLAVLLAFLILSGLSGCLLTDSTDLLLLPEISPAHAQLLKQINDVTSSQHWQSTAPVSGSNRYTLQFVDLFADGIPEAVVFFKNPKEMTIRLSVYNKTGPTSYEKMCDIDLPGYDFDTIEYCDLTGDDILEIVLKVRYESGALFGLSVFGIRNNEPISLLETTCTSFAPCDMDNDDIVDLVVLRNDLQPQNAEAELFTYSSSIPSHPFGKLVSKGTAPLSAGIRTPDKLAVGMLNEKMSCIMADGKIVDENNYVTDVLTYSKQKGFHNISYTEFYDRSFETQRVLQIYSMDVDFDNQIEFPMPISFSDENVIPSTGSQIQWFGYDVNGFTQRKALTYSSPDSKWYLLLPPSWRSKVFLRHSETPTSETLVFFAEQSGQFHDLLKIYVYISENEDDIKPPEDAFFVAHIAGRYYYAEIPKASADSVPTDMRLTGALEVQSRFVVFDVYGNAQRASDIID